jgi:tRNA uridine 5-carboxymethylaminomethyl modification enzyme
MFTSRAEYRLILREDNADLRLTETGHRLGLVNTERWQKFISKKQQITDLQQQLSKHWIRTETQQAEQVATIWGNPLLRETSLMDLLRRPEVDIKPLLGFIETQDIPLDVAAQVQVQAKYAGYIDRQQGEIAKAKRHDQLRLPHGMDYSKVSGLSNEVTEKLKIQQPETLGQASRIPGITPVAISLLLIHMKKKSA